ncbi:RBBP9/YdeN family alpha/beta hydrolase [Alicycliphilus denitrificans]|uniref:RBBP9/YdeN family alpha/beta hydrolase n=1 Tax=Alicycliphilus denitrificans TaxID=179636 RepID=UPI00384DC32F
MNPSSVLLLPGWQDSGPGHWQTEWERLHGDRRVQQHDWMRPLRGDWSARLEEVVADAPGEVVLAAHSLGCILAAWWAAHTRHAHKVRGALLVAPGDVERPDLAAQIRGWTPIARQALPFPAVLVGSRNDPYCSPERARALASDWGARFVDLGLSGHINADSRLGAWAEGRALLDALMNKD